MCIEPFGFANTKVALAGDDDMIIGHMIQKGSLLLRVSIGRFAKDRVIFIFSLMQSGGLMLLPKLAFCAYRRYA